MLDHGVAAGGPAYERVIEATEEEIDTIIMGAQSCPTLAITIFDESGAQLYPEV